MVNSIYDSEAGLDAGLASKKLMLDRGASHPEEVKKGPGRSPA